MIAILLGIATIALGLKGFSAAGIPLTKQKQITGRSAKILGTCCVVLGIIFLADGAWSSSALWQRIAKPTPQPSIAPAPVATLDPAQWSRFTAGYGNFSILLPKLPNAQDTGRNPKIGVLEGRLFQVEDGDRVYQVVYTQFNQPPTDLKKELDVVRDNIVAGIGGTLRSERDFTFAGHPAREFVIDIPDGSVARIDLVMAGPNVYQIWAVGSKGFEDTELVNDYFKSFELTSTEAEPDAEPPLTTP